MNWRGLWYFWLIYCAFGHLVAAAITGKYSLNIHEVIDEAFTLMAFYGFYLLGDIFRIIKRD